MWNFLNLRLTGFCCFLLQRSASSRLAHFVWLHLSCPLCFSSRPHHPPRSDVFHTLSHFHFSLPDALLRSSTAFYLHFFHSFSSISNLCLLLCSPLLRFWRVVALLSSFSFSFIPSFLSLVVSAESCSSNDANFSALFPVFWKWKQVKQTFFFLSGPQVERPKAVNQWRVFPIFHVLGPLSSWKPLNWTDNSLLTIVKDMC